MSTLALRVPLGEGEPAASFCSRLALRNECESATEFCREMGMSFLKVVDGDSEALKKLAYLGCADLAALDAATLRKSGTLYTCRKQAISRPILRRNRVWVCPTCLADDMARWPKIGQTAPLGRSAWLLAPIRTCVNHERELVEVIGANVVNLLPPRARHDFARLIQPVLAELDQWNDISRPRKPTPLESYLSERLEGLGTSEGWLNGLPFYAVARSCEVLGAVEISGRNVVFANLTEDGWRDAGGVGFGIMSSGPEGVRQMLVRLRDEASYGPGSVGPRALFGQLYNWLSYLTDDRVYDPLRELIREGTLETIAMGPEEEIFGRPVGIRRLHSVHSAARAIGAHPKRLRKLLHAAGFISDTDLGKTDDRAVFPADEGLGDFLERARGSMSLKEAGVYINAPRVQMKLLVRDGLIEPFAKTGAGELSIAKSDLDAFLKRLLGDATEATEADGDLLTLPKAAKNACRPVAKVVKLLLERRLVRVRHQPGTVGYMSALVDPSEVRSFVHLEEKGGLSVRETARRMRWSTNVVLALADLGVLPSTTAPNPITRTPQRLISPVGLEEFKRRYIHLHALARERRSYHLAVRDELEATGIRPAFDPMQVPATFYARADLAV